MKLVGVVKKKLYGYLVSCVNVYTCMHRVYRESGERMEQEREKDRRSEVRFTKGWGIEFGEKSRVNRRS